MTKTILKIFQDFEFTPNDNTLTDLIDHLRVSKKTISIEDASTAFNDFEDAAGVQYINHDWSPASQVTDIVKFGVVVEHNYIGSTEPLSNSHSGAILGVGRNNKDAVNNPFVLGVEGRAGVLKGTVDICAGLVGALDMDSENDGTATVGAQLYLVPYTAAQMSQYSFPYKLYAPGSEMDSRIDGRVLLGIGNADARMVASGTADSDIGVVGNVGAGEDDLHSYDLPANSLSANGKALRYKGGGYTANNANSKTLKIYFGATAVTTVSLPTSEMAIYDFEMTVVRETDSQQRAICRVTINGGNPTVSVSSPTEDETAAITIKSTGEATADSDITELFGITEFLN